MEKSLEGITTEVPRSIPLDIRVCTRADIELLADMNAQLIEDEEYDEKYSIDQLKKRMETLLGTEYDGYLFVENERVKGYALVNRKSSPIYLRHFFICRDCRRQGYGKTAFKKLIEFLGTNKMDIEVMYWNKRGYGFWKSLGFKERCISMRYEK